MVEFDVPIQWLLAYLLVIVRVGVIFFFFPLFGDDFIPRIAKAILTMAVALVLVPKIDIVAQQFPTTLAGMLLMLAPEAALGLTVGFCGRLMLEGIRAAGQFAGMQMGFMMANVVDPTNRSQISVIAQMWQISAILIFFGINGHHFLIGAIARSLETIPPFQLQITTDLFYIIHQLTIEMFILAVQISSPIVVAMLLTNVCLGLVNKVVPQMHVFMESFPLRLLLGLWMLTSFFGVFAIMFERVVGNLNEHIVAIMRAMMP